MKINKNTLAGLLILGIVFFGMGPFKTEQVQALSVTTYTTDATGVTFTMNTGRMRLQVCQEDIIRVQYTTASSLPAKTSLSINKVWPTPIFNVTDVSGSVTIATPRIKVKVDKSNGSIVYTDLNDNVILAEDSTNSKTVTPVTVEGVGTNRIETLFNSPADEALFGLGQHQDNVMNRKGTNRHIINVNTEINIPVLVSNRGYGIFWDNYSTSDFYGAESNNTKYRYVSECGEMVDYYFFYGPNIDQVVALYRTATGAAPLFPKWAYGLFHSKDKYLPSGTWYNFWTGSTMNGGSRVSVSAPLSEIPLFVKAGSIVPMGPYIQYATQSIDPLEIRVYKGQNGSFTLYEDQGDTYNYESGQSSQIQFTWNESTQQLTIGVRAGGYSGMPLNRTFNIVWVTSNHGNGVNVGVADQVVNYNGSQVVVNCASSSPSPTPTPTLTPIPTSGEGPQIGVNYTIVNRNSGKLLDVNNGSTNDGGDVVQRTGNGGASQRWRLEDAGGGYYYLVNRNSNKVVDVYAVSTADGADVVQWRNNGGANQQWSFVQ